MIGAVEAFTSAQKLADFWITRFNLGVAYLDAGEGHDAEALAELQRAEKRRGEAAAIFLDEVPSYRYLATYPIGWLEPNRGSDEGRRRHPLERVPGTPLQAAVRRARAGRAQARAPLTSASPPRHFSLILNGPFTCPFTFNVTRAL